MTATTAYGYDRMVWHSGARIVGHTHLANSVGWLTACGRRMNSSYGLISPLGEMSGEEWADRHVTCPACKNRFAS
tara:strand:- start:4634 stop:4858 length:225 start_codon:yes stop_codon:yes gene_type:complete